MWIVTLLRRLRAIIRERGDEEIRQTAEMRNLNAAWEHGEEGLNPIDKREDNVRKDDKKAEVSFGHVNLLACSPRGCRDGV